MDSKELFAKAIGIASPWYIKEIKVDQQEMIVLVDFLPGSQFPYVDIEENIDGFFPAYDTEIKRWRHLNFFHIPCYIEARVPRVRLKNSKVRVITTPWEGKVNGFTLLMEAYILQFGKVMPVHSIAKLVDVYDQKIWGMLSNYVNEARELEDYSGVSIIGIDETSTRKGHNYVTTFVDLEKKRTVFVAEGKDSETVTKFTEMLTERGIEPDEIEKVSCDMSPSFIKGITEQFPKAQIVFDKFHIISLLNKAVDEVRRTEVKTNPILRKARFAILKNECNLTIKQKEKLEEIQLSKLNLKTVRSMNIKQTFQQIYFAESSEEFEKLLKDWHSWAIRSRIEPMKEVARSIKRHWYGVVSWFKNKISNGTVEGFNSLFQNAKAKARGYKKFETIEIIMYLITGKLDFSKVNENFVTHPFL
jgi:transposase